MKFVFLFFPFLLLSGCITYSMGYIPAVDINFKETQNLAKTKKDITFSSSYYQQVGEDVFIDEQELRMAAKTYLEKSGLFQKVHFSPINDKSDYHYHFDIKITGTLPENQSSLGSIWGSALGIFPIWLNYNTDISMTLFVNGEEAHAITAAEKIKDIYWLPFIVFSPFLNHGSIGAYVRRKAMRYFINEIIEERLYEL